MPTWLADDPRPLDLNGPVDRPFDRFPDSALDRPVIDHFEQAARLHRDRIAIRNADTALTYGELWDGVSGLAEALAADGRPGELIGILLPASPMCALAMLACLAAGRPFVALDTDHPQEWLDNALASARPTPIITDASERRGAGPRPLPVPVIQLTALPRPARQGWRPTRLGPDEPACVLYTSGSTGRPKGIVNSQRNLLRRVAQAINAAHVNAEDRFLTLASPCTIVGVRDLMTALLAGASIHLLEPQRVDAREIPRLINAEAITILFAFPALLRSIATAGAAEDVVTLRLVRVGGDTTLWSDIDLLRGWLAPGARIQVIYAATEAPMLQWFVDDASRGDDPIVPIGHPLPGTRFALVDAAGHDARPGEPGELVVSSPYVALGCWVEGRCVSDGDAGGGIDACRVFRTGDLVRQRPNGLLARIGRKDRQVKIHGVRVNLEGVEARLRQHAAVRDVAVLARTSGMGGATTLVAYVSPGDAATAGLVADLKSLMRAAPAPMRPTHYRLASRIPRLPSSKLDARALLALEDAKAQVERDRPAALADVAPVTGDLLEQAVARAWQDVLVAPVSGPDDDFFDAGGDSLKAISMAMELERALGCDLSPTLIFEAPSFSGYCAALRDGGAPRHGPLVVLKPGEGAQPLFIVHGLGGNVIDLLPTARRLAYPGPVIGIRARGLANGETPHSCVEAMAADYLREIKARQPSGPYRLCGYSFGGLVAFEIARRLSESGDQVGFVGLFDTMMSPLRWPPSAWLSILRWRIPRLPMAAMRSLPARNVRVTASALIASARYRPGFYDGKLTLFAPVHRDPGVPTLEATWCNHARETMIVDASGDHATMLADPNADSIASSLTSCLRVSIDEGPAARSTC
jgi:acyl-coenzyme A synthetase/AMP-(fatty) acid ligase/thioesterase domain-containing protein/acyl carrier protein